VTDKLDGNSALLVTGSTTSTLYSRGDGEMGQNISGLLPYINGIPRVTTAGASTIVRGELIITRADFELIKHKGANARNTVAGLVNSKVPDIEIANKTIFVAYTLVSPQMKPSEQLKWLTKAGYRTVYNTNVKDLDFTDLSNILAKRREVSEFEVDGMVVTHDEYHPIVPKKNPAYAFAFKHLLTLETAEVIVTNVEWNVSKDGLIKPTVIFDAVQLSGVAIRRATGFNADYIKVNKIGPGSRLVITRSGDVIPYIMNVLTPSGSGTPQLPDIPFTWTGNKDIRTVGTSTEQDVKQLAHFFEKVKVAGISKGTVQKMHEAGYNSIKTILEATSLAGVKGVSDARGMTLLASIKSTIASASCLELMHASNSFGQGFGDRKLSAIVSALPKLVADQKYVPTLEELISVDGVSNVTATKFVAGLTVYREFIKGAGLQHRCTAATTTTKAKKTPSKKSSAIQKFTGQVVVFTGFRNKAWEALVVEGGGTLGTSVTKSTTLLVAKEPDSNSGKMKQARDKGIKIISMSEFEATSAK
jgi:DNA ligase (NAD+)